MSISFSLDRSSSVALYQQISTHFQRAISAGHLPAGSQLPTVRGLAAELGVTRLTVQNAYSELQSAGWVESTVGRGTFVSAIVDQGTQANTSALGATLTQDAVISDILEVSNVIGLRSMASASPDPRLFPTREFWQALEAYRTDSTRIASYSSSQGEAELRFELSRWLTDRHIHVTPDQIIVVNGVTQGLSLLTQALAQPGDPVLVEQPTYLGLLHVLQSNGVRPVAVPLDDQGPILTEVERLVVQERPRFFYTVPIYQNPTGLCMSADRRTGLMALAEKYGFLIIEDDIYARLTYDHAPPPLTAEDKFGTVIHVGSVSKLLMPGMRVGYVIAPRPLHQRLISLRQAADLCGPSLMQLALANLLRSGAVSRHLQNVLPIYRERRDALVDALQRFMPPSVTWTKPAGGFCTWLTLPAQQNLRNIQQSALRSGWAFAPGEVFLTETSSAIHLRLCFGTQTPDAIAEAVQTLAELIRTRLRSNTASQPHRNDWTPLV